MASVFPLCYIADKVMAQTPSGLPVALAPSAIMAVPSNRPLFITQTDGSLVENAAPTVTTTSAALTGAWGIALPSQSVCSPGTVTWTISLPDGTAYSGPITDAMCTASVTQPLSIKMLLNTWGWQIVVGQFAANVITATGPAGPAGPTGPQGPAGPAGGNPTYDLLANRPSPGTAGDKVFFVATDQNGGTIYQVESGAWVQIGIGRLATATQTAIGQVQVEAVHGSTAPVAADAVNARVRSSLSLM